MNAHSTPVAGVQPPRRTRYAALLCGALALGMAVACPVLATPGSSVTPQVLALGELPEAVRAKFKADGMGGFENGTDVAQIVAMNEADAAIVRDRRVADCTASFSQAA